MSARAIAIIAIGFLLLCMLAVPLAFGAQGAQPTSYPPPRVLFDPELEGKPKELHEFCEPNGCLAVPMEIVDALDRRLEQQDFEIVRLKEENAKLRKDAP